jgi:4-carboxymuconolactone decarboxylase
LLGRARPVATAGGLSADDIASLARGNNEFAGVDRLVLEATDEMLADGRAQAATWKRLVEELGTRPAMELIFAVGTYGMLADGVRYLAARSPAGQREAAGLTGSDAATAVKKFIR